MVFREQGNKRNVAGDLAYLARLTRERGGSDVVWRESIREALDLWSEIGNDDRWAAECLIEVAIRIGTDGRRVAAVELVASAFALRSALLAGDEKLARYLAVAEVDGGSNFAIVVPFVAAWRVDLGDQGFSAAWTTGTRLTMAQAIADARDEAAEVGIKRAL